MKSVKTISSVISFQDREYRVERQRTSKTNEEYTLREGDTVHAVLCKDSHNRGIPVITYHRGMHVRLLKKFLKAVKVTYVTEKFMHKPHGNKQYLVYLPSPYHARNLAQRLSYDFGHSTLHKTDMMCMLEFSAKMTPFTKLKLQNIIGQYHIECKGKMVDIFK